MVESPTNSSFCASQLFEFSKSFRTRKCRTFNLWCIRSPRLDFSTRHVFCSLLDSFWRSTQFYSRFQITDFCRILFQIFRSLIITHWLNETSYQMLQIHRRTRWNSSQNYSIAWIHTTPIAKKKKWIACVLQFNWIRILMKMWCVNIYSFAAN